MASIPCRDCISGTLHTDKPTGYTTTIHGISTYITRPENGEQEKGLIIYITDLFGWELPNSRLLADKYAKKGGYAVYVPDFLRGQSPDIRSSENSFIHTITRSWNVTQSSRTYHSL